MIKNSGKEPHNFCGAGAVASTLHSMVPALTAPATNITLYIKHIVWNSFKTNLEIFTQIFNLINEEDKMY
jgi:hypothetical protein